MKGLHKKNRWLGVLPVVDNTMESHRHKEIDAHPTTRPSESSLCGTGRSESAGEGAAQEPPSVDKIREERLKYLTDEKRIKAVTVLFSDLEGRLHMLDYDKKFLVKSWDNLTFDGSSIRGFTAQRESDLRLGIDWSCFLLGAGGHLRHGQGAGVRRRYRQRRLAFTAADIRGVLKNYANDLYEKQGYTLNAANEIEGFLFKGADAERRYHETGKFEYVNTGGYYHSLPGDPLRTFIDTAPKCSARWASRMKRIIPKSRPRSSKSTTAMRKWSRPPTRFSSTS